ncbi:sensor histidine kinase [Nannocystis punicea]|uniref:histidine kinase n=1 Tax=Nannocystis punicea TaxID=2995304 RepID=A0ABY7H9H8_9BACT|nr:ATP-binding protein [Nannocystis poenicansa]WAS95750.1 ATP-binding protein [Nannocystis poenicansa]
MGEPAYTVASQALAVPVALIAVVKASQAISREVTWDRLARRLLEVGLEQGGADRGCLICVERGELVVAADARVDERGVRTELFSSLPLASSGLAPTSVVQFVERTRELVMLDDVGLGGSYAHDAYFGARRPRSLLCLPIRRQAEVCAMLYLESERVAGAFTIERLTVLELIAAQGAIALENVRLFTRLEHENVERRRAEAFLAESRARLQQIVDNTTAVICLKDLDGRFLLVNRRYAELLHLEAESMCGKTDYDYFSREEADVFRASDLRVLRENRPLEFEEDLELDDGLHTYLSLKFPVADPAGRTCAICLISTDITTRVCAERERDRALLDERRSRAAAEEAVRLRDEFLLVASHELRTPLTSLQLALERLTRQLRPDGSPPVKRALEVCARQSRRMGGLVELLLDLGRVRAGRLELHRRRVDLGVLVEAVTGKLAEDLARSGCTWTLHVEEPVVGSWDGARLEQIVTGLLSNAVKFGEGRPIEIRVGRTDDTALLTLTDQGIGISPEARDRIFERFGRAVPARHYGGLGLSLFIARAIVEAHGGRLEVASAPGRGSTFTVELPLGA